VIATYSVDELIGEARVNPPEPVIDGLLFKGDICLIHGQEESYKSIFVFQLADSIASGDPLLRQFKVPKRRRVGIVETELHDNQLGERLARMFQGGNAPDSLRIFAAMKDFRSANSMNTRLKLVADWVAQEQIDVLFLDIASDFFRGPNDSASDERSVASFFETLRNMHLTCAVVRHDHKPRMEDMGDGNSNNRVRGSGEWKEDPEVVLWLAREDRRTNQVSLEVGKLRYGAKPDPMTPWFDAGPFRLTLLPPVVAVLEDGQLTRKALVEACERRFGLRARKVDEMTQDLRRFLVARQDGHEKTFELNLNAIRDIEEEPDETALWRRLVG
jgi:AAA domain